MTDAEFLSKFALLSLEDKIRIVYDFSHRDLLDTVEDMWADGDAEDRQTLIDEVNLLTEPTTH